MAGAPPQPRAMVRRFLNSTLALCFRSLEEPDSSSTSTAKLKKTLIYNKPLAPGSKHEQCLWFWKKLPWRDRSAHAIRLVGSDLRRRLRSVSSCLENSEPLGTEANSSREQEAWQQPNRDRSMSLGDVVSFVARAWAVK